VENNLKDTELEQLRNGDNWEVQMDLVEQWAEAGGYGNRRFAMPLLKRAMAMEKRLRSANIPHPLDGCNYQYGA